VCSCNSINTCNNNYSNYDGYFFSGVNRMLISDYTAYSTVYVKCIFIHGLRSAYDGVFVIQEHVLMPSSLLSLLTSSRYYLSCNDCLGDKREDYLNCSVLYCVVCTTVVQL